MISQYKCVIILLFFFIPLVAGIEVDFSLNDLDVNTQYDVDNSVYVYEEISGDPQLNAIRDYREVSGGGKKDLKQKFSSGSYTAISGVKADWGSVQSTAYLTSTSLRATQISNIGGSFAQSFLAGSQGYFGGIAFTGQYVGVDSGILSTVQTLSLGQSIYSTQSFQANGNNPLAIGYALVYFHGLNGFDSQGAFIAAGACKEGSISGNMGAEVIKVPEAIYIDPVAYGSNIVARGDEAAGIIAGAGNLKGFRSQGQFANFHELEGQGAFTGALGIGEDSLASVDYIEARTDGHETYAFEKDAKAKGDKSAIVAAGAGSFNRNVGFGFDHSSSFSYGILDMQGAFAGATAIGEDSSAKASLVGAITDGEITSAWGEDLKAKSDGFAAVGAGAGSFYRKQGSRLSPFFVGSFENLDIQGAIAGAVAFGENSKAKADYVSATTNGHRTYAWGSDLRAKSDGFAAVGAGAGNFYRNQGLGLGPFYLVGFDNLGIQGAIAGTLAGGENSKASADLVSAMTDGKSTFAEGRKMLASGDKFAATGGGAGGIRQDYGVSPIGPYYYLDTQGAIVADIGLGKDSSASADYVSAGTNGHRTYAFGENLEAKGKTSAQAIAGAGDGIALVNGRLEIDDGSVTGLSAQKNAAVRAEQLFAVTGVGTQSFGTGLQAIGDESALAYSASGNKLTVWADSVYVKDGTLTGLGAKGRGSRVMAGNLFSGKAGDLLSTSYGNDLRARGREAMAVSSAGQMIKFQPDEIVVEDGTLTGLGAKGRGSQVMAENLFAGKAGDLLSTSYGNDLRARGREAIAVSSAGQKIKFQPGEARVEIGSLTGLAANGDAWVTSAALASYKDSAATFSTGGLLAAEGDNSAALASGSGAKVTIQSDEDKGKVKVEHGSITGLTAYEDARVTGVLLASGGLSGVDGSMGYGLSASGAKSASGASGVGEKVVIKSNEDKGKTKVKEGGIVGMAAHDGAQVDADLLGSIDLGGIKGWIGLNPSATGLKAATGTGFGSEVVIEADGAKVEVVDGSLIGLTAYGANARTSAASMGGLGIAPIAVLSASDVLAEGEKSANVASGSGRMVTVESGEKSGSIEVASGSVVGQFAFGKARVTAGTLNFNGLLPSGTDIYARGDHALATLAAGNSIRMETGEDANQAKVDIGMLIGVAAENGEVSADRLGFNGLSPEGLGLKASGRSATAASAIGLGTILGTDKVTVDAGSLVGLAAENGEVTANSLGFNGLMPSGSGLKASGTSAIAASATGLSTVLETNKVTVNTGYLVGLGAENGEVTADNLGSNGLTPSGSGLKASGTSAIAASAIGLGTILGTDKVTVDAGSMVGLGAENGEVTANSLGFNGLMPSGSGLKASGTKAVAASATGLSTVLETNKVTVNTGYLVGLGAENGEVTADNLGSNGLTPSGSGLKASGTSAIAASAIGLGTILGTDKVTVDAGSLVGLAAENGEVTANSLGFNGLMPSGSGLKASGTKAVAASATGLSTVLETNKVTVNTGYLVGLGAENGEVTADNLGSNGLTPSGSGLKASGAKAVAASANGLSTVLETNKVTVNAGSLVGLAAGNGGTPFESEVTAGSLGFNGLTPSGTGLKASGWSAIAASATGLSTVLETNKVTVNAGSMVGLGAENGEVTADNLGSNGVTPSGSGLKASGGKAVAASANGLSTVLETYKVTVNAGSMVGLAAEGGQVTANSLGFNGLSPEGLGLKASGWDATAASATGLSTVLETNKVTVNAGSMVGLAAAGIVGLAAENGEVTANSLGFNGLNPSGSGLKATGASAIAASATGLSTVLETIDVGYPSVYGKVTVNAGSMVGLAASNGEVSADNLGYNGVSSIGSGLAASGDKSIAVAGAGNKITLQPNTATVEAQPQDANGVLLALGAGGSSQLSATSLEASKGLTSIAKGSGLQATGQNYAMIGVASSGSITGGTIINFQPSSSSSPYYGMTIPWGAYGGARANGGTVTAMTTPLMAKAEVTNYVIGGPGATTSNKDYANLQATGTSPVVFAAYKGLMSPSVATKFDGSSHNIWAYKSALFGNKEVS